MWLCASTYLTSMHNSYIIYERTHTHERVNIAAFIWLFYASRGISHGQKALKCRLALALTNPCRLEERAADNAI